MIRFTSLQNRLMVAFTCLSLVICIFFIRFSTILIEIAEANAYQSVLAQEEHRLTAITNPLLIPTILNSVLYTNMESVPNEIITAVGNARSGSFETKDNQQFVFRIFVIEQSPQLLLMNINSFSANQHLSQYKSLFLYSISGSAFILCLLSAWYLSKWLSRPIEQLTKSVEKRGSNADFKSERNVAVASMFGLDRSDEIGKLAKALAESYDEIQILLERERNFTRDVSHELRTPITLIKNTLTLNNAKVGSHAEHNLLKQSANELEQTVEILLALARQENLEFTEFSVLPIIEKTVLKVYHLYPDFPFDALITVCPTMRAIGNELLLGLLCQNLVNNGVYHGNGKAMTIRSSGHELIFENSLEATQERPYYQGLGHGQYLVKRIVEEMGWSVMIEQENRIYRVTISTIT
ncbi:Sensor histidine kinase, copper metabolism [Alteromonas sp. 38]|nr:Sensor histidine kinase, copper metabolism [Alteromonas sp. 154]VXB64774.1 Sensor histidine kinase, copper metabolism [Alteromonas sp. 38]